MWFLLRITQLEVFLFGGNWLLVDEKNARNANSKHQNPTETNDENWWDEFCFARCIVGIGVF